MDAIPFVRLVFGVLVAVGLYLTWLARQACLTIGIDELPSGVCEEARSLIGFWFNHGLPAPAVRRSNWARNPRYAAFFWNETIKLRLASRVTDSAKRKNTQ
jgi:hypothetical protein